MVGDAHGKGKFNAPQTDTQKKERGESGIYYIEHKDVQRKYITHIPSSITYPAPVVLMLHPGGGSAESFAEKTLMDSVADRGGFITVYPEGIARPSTGKHYWNAGNCDGVHGVDCGGFAYGRGVDDVGFISKLLDVLVADFGADQNRIFIAGFSNGAMMTQRIGCQLSEKIRGIASVGGSLNMPSMAESGEVVLCSPQAPLDVLVIHAKNDLNVPYEGGNIEPCTASLREYPSIDYALDNWKTTNSCSADEEKRYENGNIKCTDYSGCAEGARVSHCLVDEPKDSQIGGHSWPGSPVTPPRCVEEDNPCPCIPTLEMDASEYIWDFFSSESISLDNPEKR